MSTTLLDLEKQFTPAKLAQELSNNPDFRVFNLLWTEPEQIFPMCKKMGWTTVEEVVTWVIEVNKAIGNTEVFERLIDPPLEIDWNSLSYIEWPDVHKAIAEQSSIREDAQINQTDIRYKLASYEQLSLIAKTFYQTKKLKYITERNDCDDFVKALLGWLALKGLGNLCIGFAGTTSYYNDTVVGGHALGIAVDDTKTVWLIEPQSGYLHKPTDRISPKLGGFLTANSMKLARIYF